LTEVISYPKSSKRALLVDLSSNLTYDPVRTLIHVAHDLMLPKPNNTPSGTTQSSVVSDITSTVALDFRLPKRGEPSLPLGISEAVPKVAVDENDQAGPLKNKVRATRE
jgi:hypothetical protein